MALVDRVVVAGVCLSLACAPPRRDALPPYSPKLSSPTTPLLALLPSGAEAVAELDVARVRANPAVGPLFRKLIASDLVPPQWAVLLGEADAFVAGAYQAGRPQAELLLIVRGGALDARRAAGSGASAIDDHTLLLGPQPLRRRAEHGWIAHHEGVLGDRAWLEVRDQAVPQGAQHAVLRVTARFSDAARVSLAGRLRLDQVPATVSVWCDVADDLALVARLGVDDGAAAAQTARALSFAHRAFAARFLPRVALRVQPRGRAVDVTWVVGPKHLAAWAQRVTSVTKESVP